MYFVEGQLRVAAKHTDPDSPHHQRLVNLEESLRTILEVSAKHLHMTPGKELLHFCIREEALNEK